MSVALDDEAVQGREAAAVAPLPALHRQPSPASRAAAAPLSEPDAARQAVVDEFEDFAGRLPTEPAAVTALRRSAIARFAEIGFPQLAWEHWRRTDVRPVLQTRFRTAAGAGTLPEGALAPHLFAAAARLVVVDGAVAPDLSHTAGLPEGVVVGSLAAALAERPEAVARHLGRHARAADNPFTLLNTAFFTDGVYLELAPRTVVEGTIHLLYVSTLPTDGGLPFVSRPRTLIVAGEASQVRVVESFVGLGGAAGDGVYLSSPVTEIVAGPAAVVDHYKVQRESPLAFHLAAFETHLERAATVSSHSISIGGAITRNDIGGVLAGEGGDCTLNGLYLGDGEQVVDNHMFVDHAAAHCSSHELYKGILDGKSRAVFNGLIHVHPGAQKTDAKQTNRNLLLSAGALAASNPQLEIFADDVRCTHGSTVGQLDEEAVFYLRSRGIGAKAAKSLLTYAFASDIVQRIAVEPVRHVLEEILFARLPRGEVVRQAV
ncbi:MAG TPA: Fe-S cluster assembly protein SufD [Thermoanaerobaculia bacterium]|nr:Fe-S cluster assembly protein SufD [Thermoanaerobaculia bacterium]